MTDKEQRAQRWREVGCELLDLAVTSEQVAKAIAWLEAANDLVMEPAQ